MKRNDPLEVGRVQSLQWGRGACGYMEPDSSLPGLSQDVRTHLFMARGKEIGWTLRMHLRREGSRRYM